LLLLLLFVIVVIGGYAVDTRPHHHLSVTCYWLTSPVFTPCCAYRIVQTSSSPELHNPAGFPCAFSLLYRNNFQHKREIIWFFTSLTLLFIRVCYERFDCTTYITAVQSSIFERVM